MHRGDSRDSGAKRVTCPGDELLGKHGERPVSAGPPIPRQPVVSVGNSVFEVEVEAVEVEINELGIRVAPPITISCGGRANRPSAPAGGGEAPADLSAATKPGHEPPDLPPRTSTFMIRLPSRMEIMGNAEMVAACVLSRPCSVNASFRANRAIQTFLSPHVLSMLFRSGRRDHASESMYAATPRAMVSTQTRTHRNKSQIHARRLAASQRHAGTRPRRTPEHEVPTTNPAPPWSIPAFPIIPLIPHQRRRSRAANQPITYPLGAAAHTIFWWPCNPATRPQPLLEGQAVARPPGRPRLLHLGVGGTKQIPGSSESRPDPRCPPLASGAAFWQAFGTRAFDGVSQPVSSCAQRGIGSVCCGVRGVRRAGRAVPSVHPRREAAWRTCGVSVSSTW